jgi:hypothetical protein
LSMNVRLLTSFDLQTKQCESCASSSMKTSTDQQHWRQN